LDKIHKKSFQTGVKPDSKHLKTLPQLPLLASTAGDILEVFLIKHSLICSQFGRFSFASKTFKPEQDKKGSQSPGRSIGQETSSLVGSPMLEGFNSGIGMQDTPCPPPLNPQTPQAAGQRTFLRGRYAATKLYQATASYSPSNQFEIGVTTGDLLGIIQQKDPMGDRSRWFCDNGVSQGFVPAGMLAPLGCSEPAGPEAGGRPVAVVAPYDEVAEEEGRRPIRRAPGVPGLPKPRKLQAAGARVEQGSLHSYDEIAASEAAASEVAAETHSQDLSPIYEEIPGGSRWGGLYLRNARTWHVVAGRACRAAAGRDEAWPA
jgi:hypothetical protein